jgi:hypothetical protein
MITMNLKEYRSSAGPLSEDAFDGDVKFKPDVGKAYGPAFAASMKALRERLRRNSPLFLPLGVDRGNRVLHRG